MLASFLISFRETLEAAFFVGTLISIVKLNNKQDTRYIYAGILSGLFLSFGLAFLGLRQAQLLQGSIKNILQGSLMLIVSSLTIYFIAFAKKQEKNLSNKVQEKIKASPNAFGLTLISFSTVFRDGMDLDIFNLSILNKGVYNIIYGTILGLAAAIILTFIIFKTTLKLNLKLIFKLLSISLIFVGSEMFAEGIATFVPTLNEVGITLLKILFAAPSLFYFLKDDIKRLLRKV